MSILASNFISSKNPSGQYYIIGRVRSVILGPGSEGYQSPADLGRIDYEVLYSTRGKSKSFRGSISGNKPAYPMFGFLRQYPLENEVVLIFTGPSKDLNDNNSAQDFYYLPAYSLWSDMNQNGIPDLLDYAAYVNTQNQKAGYQGQNGEYVPLPLGQTFSEKYVRNLKPFEGDTIVQGRFGQSIRLGSTVKLGSTGQNSWSRSSDSQKNDPITIIVNSQGDRPGSQKFDPVIEEVYRDGSSIYLTSTQTIDFGQGVIDKFPLFSFVENFDITSSTYRAADPQNTVDTTSTSAVDQDRSTLNS